MIVRPSLFKLLLNFYPPYLGTGIAVRHVAADYREIMVEMRLRFYNRNAFGTHFGGSLFAMTDPFYALMLTHILGRDYWVWDQSAAIEFLKPGRGAVTARFKISDDELAAIQAATAGGEKHFPEFTVDITDAAGDAVARVRKILYVRRKSAAR